MAKGERVVGRNGDEGTRELLKSIRQDILNLYQRDLRAGQGTPEEGGEDMVDRANLAYNRELVLSLSNDERERLQEIDDALVRLQAGRYGRCVACEEALTKARLEAVPWARFCLDCQELEEKGLLK